MSMLFLILSVLRHRTYAVVACALAIATTAAGCALYLSVSQVTALQLQEALGRERLGNYDILVRPPGTGTAIEEAHGLVAPNHLNGIAGGISFAQYEEIRAMPGVELAAPIASLGYYRSPIKVRWSGSFLERGAYSIQCSSELGDGIQIITTEAALGHLLEKDWAVAHDPDGRDAGLGGYRALPGCTFERLVLFAAVDPAMETTLWGLDLFVRGLGLTVARAPADHLTSMTGTHHSTDRLPTLINGADHIDGSLSMRVVRLALPTHVQTRDDLAIQGGDGYLLTLPEVGVVAGGIVDAKQHANLHGNLVVVGQTMTTSLGSPKTEPAPIVYREAAPPAAEVQTFSVLAPTKGEPAAIEVRHEEPGAIGDLVGSGTLPDERVPIGIQGTFYVDQGPLPSQSLALWESYASPSATLRFDDAGQRVAPVSLPTGWRPAGSLLPPPTFLTTLDAARSLHGDGIISAVRVRVGGIKALNAEALGRIQSMAEEISAQTGLQVDVVTGSATRPVLLYVPGIGYLEQTWIQRGAAQSLLEALDRTMRQLMWPLTLLGGLLCIGAALAAGKGQAKDYCLLRDLGWPRGALWGLVLGRGLVVGVLSAAAGLLVALPGAYLLGWPAPPVRALLAIPLAGLIYGAGQVAALLQAIQEPLRVGPDARNPRRCSNILWPGAMALACTSAVSLLPGLFGPLDEALRANSLGDTVAGELALWRQVALGVGLVLTFGAMAQAGLHERLQKWEMQDVLAGSRRPIRAMLSRTVLPLLVGGALGGLAGNALAITRFSVANGTATLLQLGALVLVSAIRHIVGDRTRVAPPLEW